MIIDETLTFVNNCKEHIIKFIVFSRKINLYNIVNNIIV